MRLLEMFFGLIIIPEIHILELLRTLMTNIALFMIPLQMSSELVNIIEQLPTKGARGMEQN